MRDLPRQLPRCRLAGWWRERSPDWAGRSVMAHRANLAVPWPIDRRERRKSAEGISEKPPNRLASGALKLPSGDRSAPFGPDQAQNEAVPHGSPRSPLPPQVGR